MSEQVWTSLFTTILDYLNFHSHLNLEKTPMFRHEITWYTICALSQSQESSRTQCSGLTGVNGERSEKSITVADAHCYSSAIWMSAKLRKKGCLDDYTRERCTYFLFFFYHMRLMPRSTVKLHEEDCSNILMAWRTQGRNMPSLLTAEAHLFKDSERKCWSRISLDE